MEDLFASLKDVVVPDDCWQPFEDGWKGDWIYFQKGHIPWNKGKKGTCPLHQKEINRQMMKKRYENGLNVSGANNPRAKTWRVVYNDGRELIIKSIHDWAIMRGYSKSGIYNLRTKKWKRYRDLVTVEEVSQAPLSL